ncbi:uncharacterized protein [Watersipora subatra]|uniref:uncharacterized protein n=1 Tax=Watersipora subatra TaxID=2589382 RepID=UPI00355BA8F8
MDALLNEESKKLLSETFTQRRTHLLEENIDITKFVEGWPHLTRGFEMIEYEFRLIIGLETEAADADAFTDMVMIMTEKKGDKLDDLKKCVLRGKSAATSLFMERHPQSILDDTRIGSIVLTKAQGCIYLVLPTGAVFPMATEVDVFLAYVKCLFVFNQKYHTQAHSSVGVLVERLLRLPSSLMSTASALQRRFLQMMGDSQQQFL